MQASPTAVEQAEHLERLVEKVRKHRTLWSREERKDARILVGLLIEHAMSAEMMSTKVAG